MTRLPWPDRMRLARLALAGDPVTLRAYIDGGRALEQGEAERVARIVIGQVTKPIDGLQEDLDGLTRAINDLSAQIVVGQRATESRIIALEQRPPCALMTSPLAAAD
jgi:hypothetical protein